MARPRGSFSDPNLSQPEEIYAGGIVRDSPRTHIPAGSLYDAYDFLVEHPGILRKRGGWVRHSAVLSSTPQWVGAIHIPNKVVAISALLDLWDVTSENAPAAVNLGNIGICPQEHSSQHVDKLIVTANDGAVPPMKIWSDTAGNIQFAPLGGNPPRACYSTVYAGRIVLARAHPTATTLLNRIWFSALPDVEAEWAWVPSATAGAPGIYSFIDTTYEITGLATVQGVLLVFSPSHVERILGGVPPGESGSDMQLQPLQNVGCLDARSICNYDEEIIFAGEQGVWITNGAGVESLIERTNGTGIRDLWRSFFPRQRALPGEHNFRNLIAGVINRDYYLIHISDPGNLPLGTLLCHLPTRAWTRLSNISTTSLAQGRTEEEITYLFSADPRSPATPGDESSYITRLDTIVYPDSTNANDGDGTPVQPFASTRILDPGPGLKAYGFGHLTYEMVGTGATLTITPKTGYKQLHARPGTTFPTTPTDVTVTRRRFPIFGDGQGLSVDISQTGGSDTTEILGLEIEARPYPTAADFPP